MSFFPNDIIGWVSVIRSIVTTAAIIVGGVWTYKLFVQKRLRYPKLNVDQSLRVWPVEEKNLIRLQVKIENCGNVLFSMSDGRIWIQLMRPWPTGVKEADSGEEELVPPERREPEWPILKEHEWEDSKFEVEPGEVDTLEFNFLINKKVDTIVAHSYFKNEVKGRLFTRFTTTREQIGWNTDTVHELEVEEDNRIDMSDDQKESSDKSRGQAPKSDETRQGPPRERPTTTDSDDGTPLTQDPPKDRPDSDQIPDDLKDSGD